MRFSAGWCARILGALVLASTIEGCARGPVDDVGDIVCGTKEPPISDSARVDLGLLSVAVPNGYALDSSVQPYHGGVSFRGAQDRHLTIENGHWGPYSYTDADNKPREPRCRLVVDKIPVTVYVVANAEEGYRDYVQVGAIVAYPDDPPRGSMEALASAWIRNGDLAHARDFSRFVRSVRRGDATTYIFAPAEPRTKRGFPR